MMVRLFNLRLKSILFNKAAVLIIDDGGQSLGDKGSTRHERQFLTRLL